MDKEEALEFSTILDDLPHVDSFYGIDLKIGTLIIAVFGILHPIVYCCTLFLPMSYMLVTIWILVAVYFFASVLLFFGAYVNYPLLCYIWTWYALVFVVMMLVLMILMAVHFNSKRQLNHMFAAIVAIFWYMLTIYFILVVNSHRRTLTKNSSVQLSDNNSVPNNTKASSGDNSKLDPGGPGPELSDPGEGEKQFRNTFLTFSPKDKNVTNTSPGSLYIEGWINSSTVPTRSSIEILVSVPQPTPTHSHSEYCRHNHSHANDEYPMRTVKVRTEEPPLGDVNADDNFMLQFHPEA